jgi:hypothetical protein
MADRKESLNIIYKLLEHCDTWQEVKSGIVERGFSELLNTNDFEVLALKWQSKEASKFSDYDLSEEIKHWADGGNFNDHLKGFNAVQPKILLEEAKNRGWIVKDLASGFAINSPEKGLLFLKKICVENI